MVYVELYIDNADKNVFAAERMLDTGRAGAVDAVHFVNVHRPAGHIQAEGPMQSGEQEHVHGYKDEYVSAHGLISIVAVFELLLIVCNM